MHDQPRYKPLAESEFFSDHRSARPMVEGTVARGHLRIDEARYTGKIDGEDVDQFPDPHRQGRYRARPDPLQYLLHALPRASGRRKRHGGPARFPAASIVLLRTLMNAPVGHFFDVITNGFGAMPSYASRVQSDDRWRIVAYIRALQLSESASVNDVPADQRQNLTVEPPPRVSGTSGAAAGPQGVNQ